MIDPIQSLVFSIQANPDVYALLLGSNPLATHREMLLPKLASGKVRA